MKIVVIKDCSAGNETVGEMWKETKIFDPEQPIRDIFDWAALEGKGFRPYYNRKINITITIAHETDKKT